MTPASPGEAGFAGRSPARMRLPARRDTRTRLINFVPPGQDRSAPGFALQIAAGFLPGGAMTGGGRLLEVFLHDENNRGSERDFLLDDLGVLISLLLQLGITPTGLRRHLAAPIGAIIGGENVEQAPSVSGAVVDALIEMQNDYLDEQREGTAT